MSYVKFQTLTFLDSTIYEYQLSCRTHTLAELEAIKRVETIEELDNLLAELQTKVITGTVILFEVPKKSRIEFKEGIKMVLVIKLQIMVTSKKAQFDFDFKGTHRTLFFAQMMDRIEYDNLVKDLVMVTREKMLGERAVKNLAAAIAAPNSELNTKYVGLHRKLEMTRLLELKIVLLLAPSKGWVV